MAASEVLVILNALEAIDIIALPNFYIYNLYA